MNDPRADLRRAMLAYKAALEALASVEDDMASGLIRLANELDRQGYRTADAVQQASHYHRAVSIKSRAIAASLSVAD